MDDVEFVINRTTATCSRGLNVEQENIFFLVLLEIREGNLTDVRDLLRVREATKYAMAGKGVHHRGQCRPEIPEEMP